MIQTAEFEIRVYKEPPDRLYSTQSRCRRKGRRCLVLCEGGERKRKYAIFSEMSVLVVAMAK